MSWRIVGCVRRIRWPVLLRTALVIYALLTIYVYGPKIYQSVIPTPIEKDNAVHSDIYAAPSCGDDRQVSPDLRILRQLAWVHPQAMSYARAKPGPDTTPDEELPLIFYDKRVAYHPAFTEGCGYRCRFTSEWSQINETQLVVFTGNSKQYANQPTGGALWAFESAEPMHALPQLSEAVKKRFSMFITYHPHATVPYYYAVYRAFKNPECVMSVAERQGLRSQSSLHLLPPQHAKRTKKVAWAVSDHQPRNNRTLLGEAIAKHIEVGKYGKKAKPCPLWLLCFEELSKDYKFYLSFENANCKGYITEKFFINALGNGMVPIVYGASREEFFARAPPNSYIHVDDFKSVQDLANYLNYLDRNDTAYASYFAWKEHGEVLSWLRVDCRVCGVLHHVLAGKLKLHEDTFKEYFDEAKTCTIKSQIAF